MTDKTFTIEDINVRTDIKPGDFGYIIHRHGAMYAKEYNHGVSFEVYVAKGICEFYQNYDSKKDRVWICEHNGKVIGSLFLQHRENRKAQLRYFYLEKDYRGVGLGKSLMNLFIDFYKERGYISSYLWTTDELDTAAVLYTKYGFTITKEISTNSFGKELVERKYELV
ncbi:GNAT family N-acetyltransferase [Flavobacteriaceae bacterium S0825]|uniref:GNAT family N-acetyltransferase n=1 Tax=Gaetbulibacter sp. S0825 TaxID=2720084 RepID=UPI0014303E95|nr:GNAT family N-acetyltransferase [Gaetbulibacter sp. S0825]MCK0107883.1 GNAT family N-acetyltransferase [Flavobacteriaceae bacterium S0825]NIX63519.1 GNAT family N-acetyltransferase [Gaetbulibacter sp. S0825]